MNDKLSISMRTSSRSRKLCLFRERTFSEKICLARGNARLILREEEGEGGSAKDIKLAIYFQSSDSFRRNTFHTVWRGSIKWIYIPRHNLSSFSNAPLKFLFFFFFFSLSSLYSLACARAISTTFARNLILRCAKWHMHSNPASRLTPLRDPLLRFPGTHLLQELYMYMPSYICIHRRGTGDGLHVLALRSNRDRRSIFDPET